jgi:Flp pilus assembly pilin Flp
LLSGAALPGAGQQLKKHEGQIEKGVRVFITDFLHDARGQDLIEYALLIAFVVLASAAIFLQSSASINTIWSVTNSSLSAGAASAAS